MKFYLILCMLSSSLFFNTGFCIDPKKYEHLATGIPVQKKMQAVTEKAIIIQKGGLGKDYKKDKYVDWGKLTSEELKKNKNPESLDKNAKIPGSGANSVVSDEKDESGSKRSAEKKAQDPAKISNKATQEDLSSKTEPNHDPNWQTVGPLGNGIRKEEAPKLTPEVEKYQKEKEEFLKKFKQK